jgi:hypothetical protein
VGTRAGGYRKVVLQLSHERHTSHELIVIGLLGEAWNRQRYYNGHSGLFDTQSRHGKMAAYALKHAVSIRFC